MASDDPIDPWVVEMEKSRHNNESELVELKMRKSRGKALFTRTSNKLQHLCDDDDEVDKNELAGMLGKVEEAMDRAIDSINAIVDFYKTNDRTDEMIKTMDEVSAIKASYEETLKMYRQYGSDIASNHVEKQKTESNESNVDIGKDLWKQLQRVTFPLFSGEKKTYESWKAAFTACVDKAPATNEYKLLQMRQCLRGDALKCVEDLGHSSDAYEAAKERLERKFGGWRRQVIRFMDELDRLQTY